MQRKGEDAPDRSCPADPPRCLAQHRGLCHDQASVTSPARLTTSTSPLALSFSTTYQGSRKPPILALWPKVYRNQPVERVSQGGGRGPVSNVPPSGRGGGWEAAGRRLLLRTPRAAWLRLYLPPHEGPFQRCGPRPTRSRDRSFRTRTKCPPEATSPCCRAPGH